MKLAIKIFIDCIGDISIESTTKRHSMEFRQQLIERVKASAITSSTANKHITHLRKVYTTIADAFEIEKQNPFSKVRLDEVTKQSRYPIAREVVQTAVLNMQLLTKINKELQALIYIMASTGMRPVEILGLEADDIALDHAVPHVILRANSVRDLKTEYSDRKIPILGTA